MTQCAEKTALHHLVPRTPNADAPPTWSATVITFPRRPATAASQLLQSPIPAPPALIFQPSPSVNQAGRAALRNWVLEFEPRKPQRLDPLMGWSGSDDVYTLVRLTFPDRASAERFARRQGLDYKVVQRPSATSSRMKAPVWMAPSMTGEAANATTLQPLDLIVACL